MINHRKTKIKKIKTAANAARICGGTTGTRTLDPMIKSHLLYQLSYGPMDPESDAQALYFGGSAPILT